MVNAYTRMHRGLRLPPQYLAGLWGEARVRVFDIKTGLDGMTTKLNLCLCFGQGFTGGNP